MDFSFEFENKIFVANFATNDSIRPVKFEIHGFIFVRNPDIGVPVPVRSQCFFRQFGQRNGRILRGNSLSPCTPV